MRYKEFWCAVLTLAVLYPGFAVTRGPIIEVCLYSVLFVYLWFRNAPCFSECFKCVWNGCLVKKRVNWSCECNTMCEWFWTACSWKKPNSSSVWLNVHGIGPVYSLSLEWLMLVVVYCIYGVFSVQFLFIINWKKVTWNAHIVPNPHKSLAQLIINT